MRLALFFLLGFIGISLCSILEKDTEEQVGQVGHVEDRQIREAEPRRHGKIKKLRNTKNKKSRGSKKPKSTKNKDKKRRLRKKLRRAKLRRKSKVNFRQYPNGTSCIKEVAQALKWKYNQVFNFKKQLKRAVSHNKIISKKEGKKGGFAGEAAIITSVVGGNLSAPSCAATRSASSAASTGMTLNNCSASIGEKCAAITLNATLTGACNTTMTNYDTKVDVCIKSKTDCTCWAEAVAMKEEVFKCNAKPEADKIKTAKTTCTKGFGECKKAQDQAGQFAATCPSKKPVTTTSKPGRRRQILADIMSKNLFRHNYVRT